jgi:hypothetical protein
MDLLEPLMNLSRRAPRLELVAASLRLLPPWFPHRSEHLAIGTRCRLTDTLDEDRQCAKTVDRLIALWDRTRLRVAIHARDGVIDPST